MVDIMINLPLKLFYYFFLIQNFLSTEKYNYVGRLLKPGEQPGEYSDDDEAKETKESKGASVENILQKEEQKTVLEKKDD